MKIAPDMPETVLVRYGTIPEVARFESHLEKPIQRGQRVVVRTHRGMQLGTVLESLRPVASGPAGKSDGDEQPEPSDFRIVREATEQDGRRADDLLRVAESEFDAWCQRIAGWNLQLELIDLEWTLDKEKLILYVLNDRGPECTKLALQAAAAGLGTVEVQPVNGEGLVPMQTSGGCGSCGCG